MVFYFAALGLGVIKEDYYGVMMLQWLVGKLDAGKD